MRARLATLLGMIGNEANLHSYTAVAIKSTKPTTNNAIMDAEKPSILCSRYWGLTIRVSALGISCKRERDQEASETKCQQQETNHINLPEKTNDDGLDRGSGAGFCQCSTLSVSRIGQGQSTEALRSSLTPV